MQQNLHPIRFGRLFRICDLMHITASVSVVFVCWLWNHTSLSPLANWKASYTSLTDLSKIADSSTRASSDPVVKYVPEEAAASFSTASRWFSLWANCSFALTACTGETSSPAVSLYSLHLQDCTTPPQTETWERTCSFKENTETLSHLADTRPQQHSSRWSLAASLTHWQCPAGLQIC